jgi:hypothetical protein
VSFGFERGGRLDAVKIHRRCQGGARGKDRKDGAREKGRGHLVTPESTTDATNTCRLRRRISSSSVRAERKDERERREGKAGSL